MCVYIKTPASGDTQALELLWQRLADGEEAVRQAAASELLNARGAMLANCGRYILKVGAVLDQVLAHVASDIRWAPACPTAASLIA